MTFSGCGLYSKDTCDPSYGIQSGLNKLEGIVTAFKS